MDLSPESGRFCLVFTLSKPWENYHREQFIKSIADKIKVNGGYILCLEPTILSSFTLLKYPQRIKKWIQRKYKFRQVYNNIYSSPANTLEHILLSARFKWLSYINIYLLRKQINNAINRIDKNI